MQSALPQFKQLVASKPEESIFYTPIRNMPDTFTAAEKRSLTQAYRKTIANKLNPALRRLATYPQNGMRHAWRR